MPIFGAVLVEFLDSVEYTVGAFWRLIMSESNQADGPKMPSCKYTYTNVPCIRSTPSLHYSFGAEKGKARSTHTPTSLGESFRMPILSCSFGAMKMYLFSDPTGDKNGICDKRLMSIIPTSLSEMTLVRGNPVHVQ